MQSVLTSERTEVHHENLALEIQRALAVLADIETRFELDRESLAKWAGPEALRSRFVKMLEIRRAQERDPLVQRLAELHQRTTMLSMFDKSRPTRCDTEESA
jgi:hypothetical protein